jgi:hypothetical protein
MSSALSIEVEVLLDTSIETACQDAVDLANKLGIGVRFTFNDVRCTTGPGGNPCKLCGAWQDAVDSERKCKVAAG